MRFFLIDGSIPAVELSAERMLSLGRDGSWFEVSPREVWRDDRSPEVSRDVFERMVAATGDELPEGV